MTTDQLSALLAQDPAAVLEHDRRLYEQQIVRAADLIAAHAQERPAVLLAGPSGSGKTTTALLIERELDRRGMETHTLSMDDYFCPLTERELELFSRNELDLERPSRVDVPFFQEQLGKLLAGEEVELPHYDFKNSVRVFDGRTLRRRPGELVILEGIHALNPEVTGYDGRTTRIYVSVRTRITPRSGHPLHPSKIRLVRRMLRDSTGRGRALSETIACASASTAASSAISCPSSRAPTAASIRSIPPSSASTARCCWTIWSALPCRSCQTWSRSCGSCRTSRRISCRRIPSCANSSAAARCLTEEEP